MDTMPRGSSLTTFDDLGFGLLASIQIWRTQKPRGATQNEGAMEGLVVVEQHVGSD